MEADKGMVRPILSSHEFVMFALFNDNPVFDDRNNVRVANRGQPVCHHNGGSVHHHAVKCLLNDVLRLGVESACGLIKEQNSGVLHNSPGYGDPLFLSPGELDTPFADQRVEPLWQARYELVAVGRLSGGLDLRVSHHIVSTVHNVRSDGRVEQDRFLAHEPNLLP